MKFSVGRPSIQDIKEHIIRLWNVKSSFIVGLLDLIHVMIDLQSPEDMVRALSREGHMINACMYRLIQWSNDFGFKKHNPTVVVWMRLHYLPLDLFITSFLQRIGNAAGWFLRADDRTLALTHPMYARICVEVDVSKELPSRIWLGSSKDEWYWKNLEYEGNIEYCATCGLIGRTRDICRRTGPLEVILHQ